MLFNLEKNPKNTPPKKPNNEAKQNLEVTINFPYREEFQPNL